MSQGKSCESMLMLLQPASSLMMTQDLLAPPELKDTRWWGANGTRRLGWLDTGKQEASTARARLALSPLKSPYP